MRAVEILIRAFVVMQVLVFDCLERCYSEYKIPFVGGSENGGKYSVTALADKAENGTRRQRVLHSSGSTNIPPTTPLQAMAKPRC